MFIWGLVEGLEESEGIPTEHMITPGDETSRGIISS
jgi:hypothetical protein